MQQVFVLENFIDGDLITITGEDAHHLKNVVRLKAGEKLRVTTDSEKNYLCEVASSDGDLQVRILEEMASTELTNKIYLFQALPKGDRMETVIEKAVELGVYEIIPVEMKNCIVKLDDKKKAKKVERFNAIALSAAKQAKRSVVPKVLDVMTYKQALEYASKCDLKLLPYENKNGMKDTVDAMNKLKKDMSVAIIIGPEGGFAPEEVEVATDFDIISLGKRILRTDTAAISAMTMVMLKSEEI